jgi:two-component system NtrC family sensor kinase
LLQEEYGFAFVDLGLIDENGLQVSYAGPFELQGADYRDSEWFQEAFRRDSYISDVFLGLRDQPHFIVAVKGTLDEREWLFKATIDFAAFNTLVESLTLGQTGSAFILNRQGAFQTRPPRQDTRLDQQQYLTLFQSGEEALLSTRGGGPSAPLDRSLEGTKETEEVTVLGDGSSTGSVFSIEKTGSLGRRFIVVAAFLKDSDWLLIAQQESSDAFAQLNRAELLAGLISLLGAIGIVVAASVFSGRMVNLIATLDSEKELMNLQVIETGKLASVGELAAGIAHEINNPVAIMVEEAGWIHDLLDEGIEDGGHVEEVRRALRQVEDQGRRCKEITHKLLSFARRTESRVQDVDLNELIGEVVDLLSQKSHFANVEMKFDLPPNLPTIQASVTEMQQVFMNILHNALDAMEKTGGEILITGRTEGEHLRLCIEDSGPGIPESNLGRLFDPFFTTKPVGKGTGLGLSICYGIIKKMGGEIDVESQVGRGTAFHVVLPLDGPTAPSEGE